MALDLEAIRRKVAQLSGNGNRNTSRVNMWKPVTPKTGESPKEYKIRALPWKNPVDGQPFLERWFYYIGDNPGILSLHQFGKPDPIQEFMNKLWRSSKAEDKVIAKKLMPKMRAYAPIIVRGEEADGIKVWSFGKLVYQRMLGFFVDAEVGDILDPSDGYDLKVTFKKQGAKDFCDTEVDAARKSSPLSSDSKQAEAWLEGVPNLDDMYRVKTYDELKSVLDNWLNAGAPHEGDGSFRGGNAASTPPAGDDHGKSKLDALADEVTSESASEKPAKEKKPAKKAGDAQKESAQYADLDAAFDDLEKKV